MMRKNLHPADPVVGVSPHGDDQRVLDVHARGALLPLSAGPLPIVDVLVDAILEPVLGGKGQKQSKAPSRRDK